MRDGCVCLAGLVVWVFCIGGCEPPKKNAPQKAEAVNRETGLPADLGAHWRHQSRNAPLAESEPEEEWVPSDVRMARKQSETGGRTSQLAERRKRIETIIRTRDVSSRAFLEAEMQNPAAPLAPMAAWALGQLGDRAAVAALLRALDDPRGLVRSQALESLVRLHPPAINETVMRLLTTDGNVNVRTAAATGAGVLNLKEAVEPLRGIMRREGPLPALAAAWSLAKLGEEDGYAYLARAAMTNDQAYATRAMAALSILQTQQAHRVLLRCLLDAPPAGRREARRLLLGVPRNRLESTIGWFPKDAQVRMMHALASPDPKE